MECGWEMFYFICLGLAVSIGLLFGVFIVNSIKTDSFTSLSDNPSQ